MRTVLAFLLLASVQAESGLDQPSLQKLTVENRDAPLGIDTARPRFGWRMITAGSERGAMQTAYRLTVRDPRKTVVWDSGQVRSQESQNVVYSGRPLQPATRYEWTVTVWDQRNRQLSASSWFETGLMDPSPDGPAWSGAEWIGGGDEDLVLYAPYLSVFELSFTTAIAPGSSRASFVFGANDPRLMDKYKNIYQLENKKDQSFIRLELDISELDRPTPGKAKLHVYRAGYQASDDPRRPFRTFEIPPDVIHAGNRHAGHRVDVQSVFGAIVIRVDGSAALAAASADASQPNQPFGRRLPQNGVNLNPAGLGGDYVTYGMLCDIGFAMDAGQRATFRDVTVRHLRRPRNILFQEDLIKEPYSGIFADAVGKAGFSVAGGAYHLDGGAFGLFLVRDPSRNSMPMLRTHFRLKTAAIESARLYATARGIYELYLNGHRVGDYWYTPGFTQYNRTHLYQTYDVTGMLRPGANALGAMLGEGWWSGLLSFGNIWNHFGDRQSLRAKLVVRYSDGSSDIFVTNSKDWKYYGAGPVVYSSQYMGEVYDASREEKVKGWSEPDYQDSEWKPAKAVPLEGTTYTESPGGEQETPLAFPMREAPLDFSRMQLIGQPDEPAGVFKVLKAQSVKEVRPGVFVYNLGQNITGVPRIMIRNGFPGRKITLRFSEMLYPDLPESGKNVGMIMTENYRAALSQDIYVLRAGEQVIQPRFTWHGFQYIEITGIDRALPIEDVEGVAVSSVRRLTADFRSSNEKVNRLWQNIVWSNADNFLWIPTDCPQRNERMGWSGDLNVFSRTATYISDAAGFLRRHMRAMRDTQEEGRFADIAPVGGGFGGILWGAAGIVVPWEAYWQYGDRALLEEHYPAMAAYMSHLKKSIHPETRLLGDVRLGDWLGFQNRMLGAEFLGEAYYVWCLDIMARVAELLGKTEDAKQYRQDYEDRKAFFNATFVSPEKRTLGIPSRGFGGGGGRAKPEFRLADTQSSYAVGLALNAFSEDNVPHMAKRLAETVERENRDDDGVLRPPYSLMTGFIGTAWISKALSQAGFTEHAYRLLQATHFPSWLYPVEQGATTIWERLNGYTIEQGFGGNNSMNSFNHYSFGAVGQWLMAHCLGVERAEPGFRRFILQPEPDPTRMMTWAGGHYESPYGTIRSSWRIEDGWLTYRATVPPNTTATLYLPAASVESVTEGGREARTAEGVTLLRYENGKAVYLLVSGDYEFRARQ